MSDTEVVKALVEEAAEAFRAHLAAERVRHEASAALEVARTKKAQAARDLAAALEMRPGRSLVIAVVGEGETIEGWELTTGSGNIAGSTVPGFVEFYPKPFAVVR